MSQRATLWALEQRGLKPAAKIILINLADCHTPARGCYPSQEYIAEAAEVSRATLNRHLEDLEEAGLIRREQRFDPTTKRALSTRYHLAFEDDFQPRAVSQKEAEPCLNLAPSRVSQLRDTNQVRNQVNRTTQAPSSPVPFEAFWSVYPRRVGKDDARKAWEKAVKRASIEGILSGLKAYLDVSRGTEIRFIPHPATWLNQGRWQDDQTHAANRQRTSDDDLEHLSRIPSSDDDLLRLMGPAR